jgi:hypothetical protein
VPLGLSSSFAEATTTHCNQGWRAPGACRSKTEAEADYWKQWSAFVISRWPDDKRLKYAFSIIRGSAPMVMKLWVSAKHSRLMRERFVQAGLARAERVKQEERRQSKKRSISPEVSGTLLTEAGNTLPAPRQEKGNGKHLPVSNS